MLHAQAVEAHALVAVEAEEFELFAVQAAENRNGSILVDYGADGWLIQADQ